MQNSIIGYLQRQFVIPHLQVPLRVPPPPPIQADDPRLGIPKHTRNGGQGPKTRKPVGIEETLLQSHPGIMPNHSWGENPQTLWSACLFLNIKN